MRGKGEEEEEKEMSNESKKKKDKEKEKKEEVTRKHSNVLNEPELIEHLPSHVGSWVGNVVNFHLALSHSFVSHYIYYFYFEF